MENVETPLRERVEEVLAAHRGNDVRSTTGVQATIDELLLRVRGLEQALGAIAAHVDELSRPR